LCNFLVFASGVEGVYLRDSFVLAIAFVIASVAKQSIAFILVIASTAKQSICIFSPFLLDCFVASLLAMTERERSRPLPLSLRAAFSRERIGAGSNLWPLSLSLRA
jgi:hypothetical protein